MKLQPGHRTHRFILQWLLQLQQTQRQEGGYTLVVTLAAILLLTTLLITISLVSKIDTSSTNASEDSNSGFYTAEAGLNLRANEIRERFEGYNRPEGTAPSSWEDCVDDQKTNDGEGDFLCDTTLVINGQQIVTYVEDITGDNPKAITIADGTYAGLNAQEYRYDAISAALETEGSTQVPTSILGMHFRSRLVPLFQFAAFYDKDLEILPGKNMTLSGRVHSNGGLYLNSNETLTVEGRVSVVDDLIRGRKNTDTCNGTVKVWKAVNTPVTMPCVGTSRTAITDVSPWDGEVEIGIEPVTVPEPEFLDPNPDSIYWSDADLRIVLKLDGSNNPTGIEIRNADGSKDTARTTLLNSCGAVSTSNTFANYRERTTSTTPLTIRMLDVNVGNLFNCIHSNSLLDENRALNDATEGGLVWHFTVDGPNSNIDVYADGDTPSAGNNYGVRLSNAASLQSTVTDAPEIKGLTVVTDQAVYLQGDYNCSSWNSSTSSCSGKKPAAVLADSLNVLSNNWSDESPTTYRTATETRINAAFLAGTDITGREEGTTGWADPYNGGLENYPRLHENWSGIKFFYRGSFVSLNRPRRVSGKWSDARYSPPNRDWDFDTDFESAEKLPPLSPRFVYLVQELFERDFTYTSSVPNSKDRFTGLPITTRSLAVSPYSLTRTAFSF
jgi:Tfp pilus assembly protein PilX